jgi:hypothetical protein
MSKGIGNVNYIRQGSQVTVGDQPNWGFLYQASTVIDPRFVVGDRQVTPDGRVFRYAKAGGTIRSEFGVCVPDASITNAVAPAQNTIYGPVIDNFGVAGKTVAGATGSNVVTITVGATDGLAGDGGVAVDALRGGYIVINNGINQHPQFRGIIGNTAVIAGATSRLCDVYLDAPLGTFDINGTTYQGVVVGTTNIEAYFSPYCNAKGMNAVNSSYVTCIGASALDNVTVGQYFWVQTWGPVWLTSDAATGKAAHGRDIYINTDGSVRGQTSTTYAGYQRIGTGLDLSASGTSNGPNIMLQIAI